MLQQQQPLFLQQEQLLSLLPRPLMQETTLWRRVLATLLRTQMQHGTGMPQ